MRKTARVLQTIILPLLLGSCDSIIGNRSAAAPGDLDHSHLKPVQADGRMLPASGSLALPAYIEMVGDRLVLIDVAADSVIQVLDNADGKLVRSFGRRGAGPGEFEGAWAIDPVRSSDDQFWIYDLSLRRLTHIDLEKDFPTSGRQIHKSLSLISETTILDPVWADTTLIALGFHGEGRFGFFDRRGKLLRTAGELPMDKVEVPATIRQQAYQSILRPNPERSLLAVATRHADLLDIYQIDGTLVASARPPFSFTPSYEVQKREDRLVMATGSDLRFGYIDLATTDDHIYALFSGRTRRGFPGAANYGEYVHIYDWSGALVRVLHLDAPSMGITVDKGGTRLYSIRHEPSPAVVEYELPRV